MTHMAQPAPSLVLFEEDDSGPHTAKISTPMSVELEKRIQDYRFGNRIGSQSDAVRRLIIKGLKAEGWWRRGRPS